MKEKTGRIKLLTELLNGMKVSNTQVHVVSK